jgi:tetratricopeptide (TPR) repeat protein
MENDLPWPEAEWVHLPALTLDAHGQPDYGALLRYVRKEMRGWSADYVAEQYSTALWLLFGLEDVVITARWIQKMEHDNLLPQDPLRRAALAAILGIPPTALGLEDVFKQTRRALLIPRKQRLDPEEYRAALASYWQAYYAGTVLLYAEQIMQRLYDLHDNVLYVKEPNVFMDLLCRYHILIACIARDQGDYQTALEYLRDALTLAKRLNNQELRLTLLYRRAGTYFDKGDSVRALAASTQAVTIAQQLNVQRGGTTTQHINSLLDGAIHLMHGTHFAHQIQHDDELTKALKQIDEGQALLEEHDGETDEYFVDPSPSWIHSRRALVYLESPLRAFHSPEKALIEIAYAKQLSAPTAKRSLVYTNYVEARAYIDRGQPEWALKLAEDTLERVEEMQSAVNLDRLGQVYRLLREHPTYGGQTEVSQFGLRLKVARIKLQMLR